MQITSNCKITVVGFKVDSWFHPSRTLRNEKSAVQQHEGCFTYGFEDTVNALESSRIGMTRSPHRMWALSCRNKSSAR
jgi:hypothetical protein